MRNGLFFTLAAGLALGLGAPAAPGDTVVLTNGREYHGRVIAETPGEVQFKTRIGTLTIERSRIARIEITDRAAALKELGERRAALSANPADYAALAEWCDRQGLFKEADQLREDAKRAPASGGAAPSTGGAPDGSAVCRDCFGAGKVPCPDCRGTKKLPCPVCGGTPAPACAVCQRAGTVPCPECEARKTVQCPDCQGTRRAPCPDCRGERAIVCPDCGGAQGVTVCPDCNGAGVQVRDGERALCPRCAGQGRLACARCSGKGRIECNTCEGRGNIACARCDRRGRIACPRCEGAGRLPCAQCGGRGTATDPCAACAGTGVLKAPCLRCDEWGRRDCERCGGTGRVNPQADATAGGGATDPSRQTAPAGVPAFTQRGTRRRGADGRAEQAVEAGLRWLARHQGSDGGWHAEDFHNRCNEDPKFPGTCANAGGGQDIGWEHSAVGVSGLALLAFLGAGYTLAGEYQDTIANGLKYALAVQNAPGLSGNSAGNQSQKLDGSFGPQWDHSANYSNACMTMAVAEAYGMTGLPRLREAAQRGVDYIAHARNDGMGWRYGIKPGENDSSVTGWMVLALKSAEIAGLQVDRKCFDGALAWFDLATDPDYGKVGYMQRGGSQSRLGEATHFATNEALTAVGITSRLSLGIDRADASLTRGATRIAADPPTWEPGTKIDMYYWYWGSLALYQMGDPYWKDWQKPMIETLVKNQRQGKVECAAGSWDPIGAWGVAGGRVYSTAMCVLTLETTYRYQKFAGR